ncbi:MAG TPA: hypothetical protein PK657_10200 [Legionella sp.]|nr:hypothetical protein [Legionella sp.]
MEKLKVKKLKGWKVLITTPLGIFLSIAIILVIYWAYLLPDDIVGKTLGGIIFVGLFFGLIWFNDYKDKCYLNYRRSISLLNDFHKKIDNFSNSSNFNELNQRSYLTFLNSLYNQFTSFNHFYLLAKVQFRINELMIKESDETSYLYDELNALKEAIFEILNTELEVNTGAISFLLENE